MLSSSLISLSFLFGGEDIIHLLFVSYIKYKAITMQTNFIEIENSKYLINQAIDALNSNYSDIENLISSDLISVNKDTYHFISDLLLKTNQKDS